MILRTANGRTQIVLQTDHAKLCGEFASAWGGDRFHPPEPLAPVRIAAEMHDHGWFDWERAPRVKAATGKVYDFLEMPTDVHVELYDRGIRMALDEHPYAGLLVSLHGTGLYKKRYGYMPELSFKEVAPEFRSVVDSYLAQHDALQTELMAALHIDPQVVWTHYRWLQAWDLLSLSVCRTDPAEGRRQSLGVMPLYPGGPEERLEVQGAGPGRFTVTPWPFAVEALELVVPVRFIADRAYTSDDDLQAAMAAAPTQPLRTVILRH